MFIFHGFLVKVCLMVQDGCWSSICHVHIALKKERGKGKSACVIFLMPLLLDIAVLLDILLQVHSDNFCFRIIGCI